MRPNTEAASAPPKLKILLAEDDELIREFVARVLDGAGHRADAVGDGNEALMKLREGGYDLAVLDFYMPGPGVAEIVKWCRTGRERPVPVIVLTACATQAASIDCASSGANAVLTKPVTRRELLDAIDKIAAGDPSGSRAGIRPASAVGVLDESKIEELAYNDPTGEFRRQFLRKFVSRAGDIVDRIERAVRQGDTATVRELAHKLEGSAGTAGAMAVASVCGALRQGASDEAMERVASLRHALADVARRLNEKYDVGAQE